jgi:superfamily I DNA/RNA helicase
VQSRGADLAEERRLFYVGRTGALLVVVFLGAGARQRHGKRLQPAMAPFVGELPRELLVEEDVAVPHQEKRVTQLSLF